jgi:hypothetical protein
MQQAQKLLAVGSNDPAEPFVTHKNLCGEQGA